LSLAIIAQTLKSAYESFTGSGQSGHLACMPSSNKPASKSPDASLASDHYMLRGFIDAAEAELSRETCSTICHVSERCQSLGRKV
jgi:hypothetical protein